MLEGNSWGVGAWQTTVGIVERGWWRGWEIPVAVISVDVEPLRFTFVGCSYALWGDFCLFFLTRWIELVEKL
jgi:hypothetical protein